MDLTVLNSQRSVRISVPALRGFLRRLLRKRPPRGAESLGVCLVSDSRMREYNRTYRGKDRPTDVLSFPDDGTPDPAGEIHLGDIVISAPTAARQAREAGHSPAREVRILALHGYLHLLGYDHETDGGTMMRLQRRLERQLLPAGTRRKSS